MNIPMNIREMEVFKRHSTPSILENFLPTGLQIDKYFTLISFSIGIIGNILSTIVWWYPRVRFMESTVLTLLFISIVDLAQLIIVMISDMQRVWAISIFFHDVFCKTFTLISNSVPILSTLLLLTISTQHYITLKNNPNYQYYKCKKWSYLIISLLTLFSILISIPDSYFSFLDFTIYHINECHLPRNILSTKSYAIYYWIVKFFFLSVSMIALSFMSIMILHKRDFNENKGDFLHQTDCTNPYSKHCSCNDVSNIQNVSSLSTVVTILGFYEVFSTIPQIIMKSLAPLNNYGDTRMTDFEVRSDPIWERHFNMEGANILFDEIHLTIYSFKFFIYLVFNADFRQSFGEIFGIKLLCHKPNLKLKKNLQKQNSKHLIDKEKTKPMSYYLQRSQNTSPIKYEEETDIINNRHKSKNYSIKNQQNRTGDNLNEIKIPKLRLKKNFQSFDNDTNSTPKLFCCPKHYEKYIQKLKPNDLVKNKKLQKKNLNKNTQFHNVCSEFQYESKESINECEDSSKIFYVDKCQCSNSESDTSHESIILKIKKSNQNFHQV